VASHSPVGVDDDLAPGQPGVSHRASGHELARRVDEHEVALLEAPLVVELAGENRMENVLDDVRLDQSVGVEAIAVLGRDEHASDLHGPLVAVLVDLIPDRHLSLTVRTQVRQDLRFPHLGQAPADPMSEHDRERHQLLGLNTGEAEHHSLVAGAGPVERVVVAGVVLDLVGGVDA